MATTLKPVYAASAAITLGATLAATVGAAEEITAIDNTVNLYDDAQVSILLSLANTAPGSDQLINIWFGGSEDGTHYTDNFTGTSAAISLRSTTAMRGPFVFPTPVQNISPVIFIPSVLRSLGCIFLPRKWTFAIENRSNMAISLISASYTGLQFQNV